MGCGVQIYLTHNIEANHWPGHFLASGNHHETPIVTVGYNDINTCIKPCHLYSICCEIVYNWKSVHQSSTSCQINTDVVAHARVSDSSYTHCTDNVPIIWHLHGTEEGINIGAYIRYEVNVRVCLTVHLKTEWDEVGKERNSEKWISNYCINWKRERKSEIFLSHNIAIHFHIIFWRQPPISSNFSTTIFLTINFIFVDSCIHGGRALHAFMHFGYCCIQNAHAFMYMYMYLYCT